MIFRSCSLSARREGFASHLSVPRDSGCAAHAYPRRRVDEVPTEIGWVR